MRNALLTILLIVNLTGFGQVTIRGSKYTVDNTTITVDVFYASAPTSVTTAFADLKYNKAGVFQFECDDNSKGIRDVFAYWQGGKASDSITYSGLTFTDGCGNNVKFRGALAVNGKGGFLNNDLSVGYPTSFVWSEIANLVNYDWGIENHSYYHDPTTRYSFKYDAGRNVRTMHKLIWDKLLENNVQYITRTLVSPTNWKNFYRVADSLGYLCAGGQNQLDGYTLRPTPGQSLADLNALPPGAFVTFNRWFEDVWSTANTTVQKTQFDNLVSSSTSTAHKLWRLGTHGPQVSANFLDFSNYIAANHGDKIWICSMHELMEYLEVKRVVKKTQTLVGNRLTIKLNLSAVPKQNRFRDMSLLLNSGGISITSVVVTNADNSSYNASSGLINIFKKKVAGFAAP